MHHTCCAFRNGRRAWLKTLRATSAGLDYERHCTDRPAVDQYVVQREVSAIITVVITVGGGHGPAHTPSALGRAMHSP